MRIATLLGGFASSFVWILPFLNGLRRYRIGLRRRSFMQPDRHTIRDAEQPVCVAVRYDSPGGITGCDAEWANSEGTGRVGAMTGLFVSFEGVDGVGKTTQVERLRAYFEARGREVVVTREPGGTELGRMIRRMLLHGVGSSSADIAPRAEALLFAADRAQHVAETIRPALDRGAVVITDRYLDSSLAYQAGGRELTAADVRSLSMWATGGLLPARTYLLDMDPSLSHARLQHRADRM